MCKKYRFESFYFRWTQARSIYYPKEFYFTNTGISFDPEGILGSINNVVVTFLGLHCGRLRKQTKSLSSKLIALGCVLFLSSVILDNTHIPE